MGWGIGGARVRGWWGWCVVGPGLEGPSSSSWGLWSLVIRGCLMVIGSETGLGGFLGSWWFGLWVYQHLSGKTLTNTDSQAALQAF